MLNSDFVVLDFEGLRHKKTGFIIKELSSCSNNYSDTIFFLPPVPYNSFSASERKSHQWVSRFLHGLSWNTGSYPYWFLSQIFIAIKLRFPSGKFYAKAKEKSESFQNLLQKEVVDLDTLLCPKVEEISLPIKQFTCALHSFNLPEKQKKRHCAKRKAQLYFYWLTLPTNEPSSGECSSFSSSSEFISNLTVCSCITNDNQITVSLVREEKIETRGNLF